MSDANLALAISTGSAIFVGLVLPLAGYLWRDRDSTMKRVVRSLAKLERAVTRLQVQMENIHGDRRSHAGTESLAPDSDSEPPDE